MTTSTDVREGFAWTGRRIVTHLLNRAERRVVARCAIENARPDYLNLLAGVAHFRPQTLGRMPKERLVRKLDSLLLDPRLEALLNTGLAEMHLSERSELMGAFLDYWGVEHENGQIRSDDARVPSLEIARASVDALRGRFSVRHILTYFATAGQLMGAEERRWRATLWPVADELFREDIERADEADPDGIMVPRAGAAAISLVHQQADAFTTLDEVILRQIESSVSGIEGALSMDEIADLVEEVIQLNAERHRSYYHRGYLRALLGDGSDFEVMERSGRRRAWLLSGRIMALGQSSEWEELVRLYKERRDAIDELLACDEGEEVPGFVSAARVQLFEAFSELGRPSDAISTIDPRIAAALGERFLSRLQRIGTRLLRERRPAEATQYYDLVRRAVTKHLPAEDAPARSFVAEIDRRRAQCLRSLGRFTEAERDFERLLGEASPDERGPLLVDVGLARGGFRSLTEVGAPRARRDVAGLRERIDKGMQMYEEALGVEKQRTNAHYVLGVKSMLEECPERAVHHLELAYLGAGERSSDYMEGGLYDQIRLYHALSILMSLDEGRLGYAVDLLESVGERLQPDTWPEWLMRRASEVVELGTSDTVRLMRFFVRHLPSVADLYLRNGLHLERVPELEERLARRACASGRSLESRWQDLDCLAKHRIRHGRLEEAGISLDAMEDLAMRSKECRAQFLRALRDNMYAPAWSEREMMSLRAAFLEMDGELEQAANVLLNLVYQHASHDEWDEAIGLTERIAGYGPQVLAVTEKATGRVAGELAKRERDVSQAHPVEVRGGPIRILFVGGNETQARYDEEVTATLEQRFPGLELDFEHPGWGSSWNRDLEDMQPRLERSHGIVVMHFIRTQLGRHLRRKASDLQLPWGACTGHGREAILGSIERLALRILEIRGRRAG